MNRLILWPAIVLSLLVPPAALAQTPQAATVSEFDVNGLKVLVKPRPGTQTVAAGLFIRGGSRNVTADNAGIEALMLDVATEASTNFPRAMFRRELARTGSVVTYGVNQDYSVLSLTSTRRHFDRSWEIFVDAALRPAFGAEDFDRVKQRRLVALSDEEDTPDSFLQVLQSRAAHAGHPYAVSSRGTVASVTKLTLDDVRRYHRQIVQSSRLLLVVVGNVEPAQIRQKAAAAFAGLPRGAYVAEPLRPLTYAAPALSVTEREISTNYVQGLYAAPALTSPDIYPMRVLTAILRDRLFEEIRVKRNLSYAPHAVIGSDAANSGLVYVTSTDANQSVKVMLGEITALQSRDVRTSELQAVAQQFLTEYYTTQETNAAQAGELARYEIVGGGWRNVDEALARLRAVTAADVRRVANTYLRNLQWVVLGNPRSIDRQIFLRQPGG